MIIPNGHIRIKTKVGGGIDAAGFPVEAASSLSEPIECQFRSTSLNLGAQSASGESVVRQGYTVLIEERREDFYDETIVLYDRNGQEIGEFEVLSIKWDDSVCQTRINV